MLQSRVATLGKNWALVERSVRMRECGCPERIIACVHYIGHILFMTEKESGYYMGVGEGFVKDHVLGYNYCPNCLYPERRESFEEAQELFRNLEGRLVEGVSV